MDLGQPNSISQVDSQYALIIETARLGNGGECRFDHAIDGAWVCDLQLEDQSFLIVRPADPLDPMVFFADFGEIPEAQATACMSRILEVNLALADSGRAGFGLDSQTGHLIYALPMPAAQVSARSLRLALENIAAQARAWRQDYFLGTRTPDVAPPDLRALA